MEDKKALISRLMAPTRLPLIGKVVAWSIGSVAVTRDDLIRRVHDAGLDDRFVPKAIRARTCMLRTLNDLVAEGFMRRVVEEADRCVYVMVTEEVDPQRLDVRFSVETTFTFDKQSKQLTCDDVATQARVNALMEQYAEAFLPSDIRRFLLEVIKQSAGALTLRDRGGVYLVPTPKFPVVSAMENFVNGLGPSCSIMVLNVPETQADVAQVFKAFESEFLSEMEALSCELDEMEGEAGSVRPATWQRRLQDFQVQREKARMFSDLLAIESSNYATSIAALEARVRARLIG